MQHQQAVHMQTLWWPIALGLATVLITAGGYAQHTCVVCLNSRIGHGPTSLTTASHGHGPETLPPCNSKVIPGQDLCGCSHTAPSCELPSAQASAQLFKIHFPPRGHRPRSTRPVLDPTSTAT